MTSSLVAAPLAPDPVGVAPHLSGKRSRARLLAARWLWPVLVVLLFGIPLFFGLGSTDFENDEAFHSLTVEAMVKDGDYLTPRNITQGGGPFLEKPPLKFWIVAAPLRLGLVKADEFGMRVSDAIIATLGFLYVFALGRRLAGPVCGLGAVLILFAHQPLLFDHGLLANDMESTLLLAYSGGVYHYLVWRAETTDGRRRRHLLAVALFVALGFMVKFVAVAFLPVVLVVATLASSSARTRLRADWRAALLACAVAAAVVAPWFVYQSVHFGTDFWRVMFGDQVFTRFTKYLNPAHLNPWHYYWTTLFSALWSSGAAVGVALGLILLTIHAALKRSTDAAVILVWLVVPLSLMSLMTSKLYHYAYPHLPPFALAGAYGAATLAAFVWSASSGFRRLDARIEDRLPAMAHSGVVRALLLAAGIAAAAVAVWTQATDQPIRLAIGPVVLLRSASALRAWLLAALMLALACRLGSGLRVAAVALALVVLLPVSGYTRSIARLPVQNHPLRSIGGCVKEVAARSRPGELDRGMWIEAEGIAHFWFYYFHELGPFQERSTASDPTVFMHLYLPSMRTPVLLSQKRNREFFHALETGRQDLLERVAKKTGLDVGTVGTRQEAAYVTSIRFPGEVLLLPGPFSVCAVEYERERAAGR